mmetsp:Transcript_43255/g.113642  ORF Transcript_43255/g.113642 Transcript_43255/m.113642 type:complete len:92 (+) Transcript_43255:1310-1585(+)
MRPGEALLFKQFDSVAERAAQASAVSGSKARYPSERAAFTLHSAFVLPGQVEEGPPRKSVEFRLLVFDDRDHALSDAFGLTSMAEAEDPQQ